MASVGTDSHLPHLRERRREMRRELARVRWWRRLVQARKDLSVAQLGQFHLMDSLGADDAWEALVANTPTPEELSKALWPEQQAPTAGGVETLESLDARLQSYEERVSDNLEAVTAQMVRALGDVHRMRAQGEGGTHG